MSMRGLARLHVETVQVLATTPGVAIGVTLWATLAAFQDRPSYGTAFFGASLGTLLALVPWWILLAWLGRSATDQRWALRESRHPAQQNLQVWAGLCLGTALVTLLALAASFALYRITSNRWFPGASQLTIAAVAVVPTSALALAMVRLPLARWALSGLWIALLGSSVRWDLPIPMGVLLNHIASGLTMTPAEAVSLATASALATVGALAVASSLTSWHLRQHADRNPR